MIIVSQPYQSGPLELCQEDHLLTDKKKSKGSVLKIGLFGLLAFLTLASLLAHPRDAFARPGGPGAKATARQAANCEGGGSDCPYTRDVYLGDSGFRQSFVALLRAAGVTKPDWIPNGLNGPMSPVVINGKQYIAGHISEPHNAPHTFNILYAIDSGRMVAQYFDEDGNNPTWLGSPTAAERKAMSEQAN